MRFEKELMGMLWKVNENEIKLRNKQAAPKQQAGPHPTKKLVRMVSNQWFILLDHSFLKSLFNLKKQKSMINTISSAGNQGHVGIWFLLQSG